MVNESRCFFVGNVVVTDYFSCVKLKFFLYWDRFVDNHVFKAQDVNLFTVDVKAYIEDAVGEKDDAGYFFEFIVNYGVELIPNWLQELQ